MKWNALFFVVTSILFLSCQTVPPTYKLIRASNERVEHASAEALGSRYAISTQGKYASEAAEAMFAQGGNIIDATIAASFAISVERPQSTGLGGGGFMLFTDAKSGETFAIDFRERAPGAAHANMYIDKNGQANLNLSQNGMSSVAVPGLVAGLLEIHQRFGSLPLNKVLLPAIQLAENGFSIYPEFHTALLNRASQIRKDGEARRIFLTPQGEVPPIGSILVQKDLAKTLRRIGSNGKNGFYKGFVADSIVKVSKAQKAWITQKDLDGYQVKWRQPLQASYSGMEIFSMPPPSSGGVHVIQFLKFLERDNLQGRGFLSASSIHLAASALQSAFVDRATYLGDPDFVKVPTAGLIQEKYILQRRNEVSLEKARKLNQIQAGRPFGSESTETTHISIMDSEGNAVSTTQTINGWMGSGVVAPGTGVVLNNEMDDFSAQVGSANLFGAIGSNANSIAPQKTPLSSMSPTIIKKNDVPVMAVGAPGGTRIISCVAQTILNYFEFKMPLYDAVTAVRYHHQWQPDVLFVDPPGPRAEVLQNLQKMGYEVKIEPVPCFVMAVAKEGDKLHGVADPRDIGISLAR